jgi:tetratricopeptide (TPR) repeat protein
MAAKGFLPSAKSYTKNLVAHTWLLMRRKETVGEAWESVARDSEKLKRTLESEDLNDARTRASHLVKEGRRKYNAKDYQTAENCFRSAILEDPRHTWAVTYLGHALYKLGRLNEALAAWQRAYAMDPTSDAGLRAQQKLRHVERQTRDLVAHLEEHTNR